jgi:hypothetical protein
MKLHLTLNPASIRPVIVIPSRRIIPSLLAAFLYKGSILKIRQIFTFLLSSIRALPSSSRSSACLTAII